ncbi:hypothetical protein BCBBV1cgp56 [Bacillus phage BCASJ1c]|uniref:56 n=1 Tax=Bacillus phage BCASJ1c TaxID=294382 RepID=Q5YA54_9CAUD|nr:hypothetical protein BCBBV1cgp56 [Bacillus phage BCASJ1c]AAU85103.1 56 [Bacillus phage BCASJ1c]
MPEEDLEMRNRVDDHENRIQSLESYRVEQEKINSEIRQQMTSTENTVLKESSKQQELSQRLLDHVLENDIYSRKSVRERKEYTQKQVWKIAGILAGSGGLLYLLIESFAR